MVEKLKRYRLTPYLYYKKSRINYLSDTKKRKFNFTKSNSFNIKTETNDKNIMPLLYINNQGNINNSKFEEKLKNKNTQLQLNLNKFNKELILAKSAEHKKIFELKKKEKLLNKAINIKKLTLQPDTDNFLYSTNTDIFLKEKENELIEKSFQSNLLYKIKKQYFNLEKEYNGKLDEISNLKNNIKNCQNKELIQKNNKLLNDFKELKKNYDLNVNKNNEYKIKIKDYIELEDKLTRKNFFILNLQEQLKEINNNNTIIENDIEEMRLKLKFLEEENKVLNSQFDMLNDNYNQVAINKKEIENKYEILLDDEKEINDINFSNPITE